MALRGAAIPTARKWHSSKMQFSTRTTPVYSGRSQLVSQKIAPGSPRLKTWADEPRVVGRHQDRGSLNDASLKQPLVHQRMRLLCDGQFCDPDHFIPDVLG